MSEFENLKMKKILQLLFEHKSLSRTQAKEVLLNIGKAMYNEHGFTNVQQHFFRLLTIKALMFE